MIKLRSYQTKALDAIEESLKNGIRRQLIVMATGLGKTIVFSHIPQRIPGRMLVLAHREELLHQAREKILWANPELRVDIEQAENVADEMNADVVVASVATLGRDGSPRLTRFPRNYFTTIIVDESHHATAATYQRILEYFTPKLQLGVTATPQRSDKTRLLDVFDEITFFMSIYDGIEEGYLCDLAGVRIPTDVDISDVTTRRGDYAEGELATAVNVEKRNKIALEAWQRLAVNKKTLIFCAGVQHAYDMAETFRKEGFTAETIVGETDNKKRKDILKRFQAGKTQTITNAMVLTEGFDEPSIECIVLARPTKSQLLFTQVVGRGTRLHPGKDNCLVIDLADATQGKKPVGLPTLMGLPPDFDAEGENLSEVAKKFNELAESAPQEAARVRSVKDIDEAWERIDLFLPPPPNPELLEFSHFIWMETSADTYVLNLADRERLHISGDTLGRWTVTQTKKDEKRVLGVCETMEEAFRRSDRWVQGNRGDQLKLLNATEQWRNDSPTDKQLKWLRKFGVPITVDLTKGQASLMLDKLFAENPQPKKNRPKWVQDKIDRERAAKRGW